MSSELAAPAPGGSNLIPGDFAEKAMASLMQLHCELMDEKERRVELYRKLMEREQIVAELRMYVKLLEERLDPKKGEPGGAVAARPVSMEAAPAAPVAAAAGVAVVERPRARVEVPEASAHARAPFVAPPIPPRVTRPKVDGWKTW